MAASELESHSGAKLANSGEITNGYEYSQECFHLKRLLSNVSSLGCMPAQEQSTGKGRRAHCASADEVAVTAVTARCCLSPDLRGTPGAGISEPSQLQPALLKIWSNFETSSNLYLAKVFCTLLIQDALPRLFPTSHLPCCWSNGIGPALPVPAVFCAQRTLVAKPHLAQSQLLKSWCKMPLQSLKKRFGLWDIYFLLSWSLVCLFREFS